MDSGFWTGTVRTDRLLLTFLILFFFSPLLASESMIVDDLLGRTGATLKWEPYHRIGLLEKGEKSISFSLDNRWMIGDYNTILPSGAVMREKGVLIFSKDAAQTVLKYFGEAIEEENPYSVKVILIDPGHGGRDPGTSSTVTVNNIPVLVQEKNINLDVSLRLAEMLRKKYPGKQILLTRTDDTYPTLEERVEMANGIEVGPKEGIIYISVHVNASLNRKAEGYEIWHLPGNYRRDVVDRDDYEGDESLIPVVNSILEERYAMESIRLASNMLEGLDEQLPEVPNRGLKEESWFVVRNTRMAAVLVELGYITNKEEALRMMQTSYLKKLTNGLYNGINRFIDYYEEKGFD